MITEIVNGDDDPVIGERVGRVWRLDDDEPIDLTKSPKEGTDQ